MKIFFDTEFIDNASEGGSSIELISIGAVTELGDTYYAENSECPLSTASDWVKQNVIAHLNGPKKRKQEIMRDLLLFCGARPPQFWTYYGAHDWVMMCQLFGGMMCLPGHWPMYNMDITNALVFMNRSQGAMPPHTGTRHHALDDAIWTKKCYEWLKGAK